MHHTLQVSLVQSPLLLTLELVLPGVHKEFQILRQMVEHNRVEGVMMKDHVVLEIQTATKTFQMAL